MTYKQRPPVPEGLLREGKPYWEKFGGGGVSLVGRSVTDMSVGAKNSYWDSMRERGFYINNYITDQRTLESMLPVLYEGELGIVVVIGSLPETSRGVGQPWTSRVPETLSRAGYEDATVVLAFERELTPRQIEQAGQRGYDVIAPYATPLERKFEVAARAVELGHAIVGVEGN